jgi:hypothetical protein
MKQVVAVVTEFCAESGKTPHQLLVFLLEGVRAHHARLRAASHSNLLSEVQVLARGDPTRAGIPRSTLDLLARHMRVHNLDGHQDFQGEAAVLLRILKGCMGDAGPEALRTREGAEDSGATAPISSLAIV